MLRTLWPMSRPMSQSRPISCSMRAAVAESCVACCSSGTRISRSTSGAGIELAPAVAAHGCQGAPDRHRQGLPDIAQHAIDQRGTSAKQGGAVPFLAPGGGQLLLAVGQALAGARGQLAQVGHA
jgi:hypothetical protein